MLDVDTLRFVLGTVSVVVFALFYLGVYRPTRSPFSGWWTLALVCAAVSASLLLWDGTSLQVVTNPGSTAASAAGATCVWFAARSLRNRSCPLWVLVAAPLVSVGAAALDSPSSNTWAGSQVLFVVMAAGFTAGAVEVWDTWRERRGAADADDSGEAITALLVSAIAATVMSVLSIARSVLYPFGGADGEAFRRYVGSGPASLTLLLCLVAVTFTVSSLGWDQRMRDLRRRAREDDLTGLLGRTAFLARAQAAISAAGGRRTRESWLVIADIDDFKPINDAHGHQAGDRTLQEFANVAARTLRSSDAIGRLGGDEFGFVLENVSREVALARLDEVRARLAVSDDGSGRPMPTVSFGVTECLSELTLSEAMGRADAALYVAKRSGRDRASVFEDEPSVR